MPCHSQEVRRSRKGAATSARGADAPAAPRVPGVAERAEDGTPGGVLAESWTRCAFAALCPEDDDVVSADGCWLLFWQTPVSPPGRRKRKASYASSGIYESV